MWYSKQLRLVRRARRAARAQQYLLFALELEGIVALTLHSATGRLTIPIERAAGAQVVDTLLQTLRARHRALKTEAQQLREDWQESVARQAPTAVRRADHPPADETPAP